MTKKKTPTKRKAKPQPDPFFVFGRALAEYLETIGWRAIVAGRPRIRGIEKTGLANYTFEVDFSGFNLKGDDK